MTTTLTQTWLGLKPYLLIELDAEGDEDDPDVTFSFRAGGLDETPTNSMMVDLLEAALIVLREQGERQETLPAVADPSHKSGETA